MRISKLVTGPLQVNCYILKAHGSNDTAIVDPGGDTDKIISALDGCALKMILLTHGHFDHIIALDELREKTGAPVYIHKDDALCLSDSKLNCSHLVGMGMVFRPPEHLLEDGGELTLGDEKIKVIHTPGHSKGSVVYVTGNIILSGDTLFENDVGRTDLYGGSHASLVSSLKTISALPGDYNVFPGHGPSTTLSAERENNVFLRYLERETGTDPFQ